MRLRYHASCTKSASHKRLGVYLSNFSELTIKFTNILKTDFLTGKSCTCPQNKPVYVWPTQSTLSVKMVVYLRKRSHIDYYYGSALKLINRPTCCRSLHRTVGKLIWPCGSQSMDQNPKKGGEGSKMDRAEAIQIGVVDFERYHCLSASLCLFVA